MDEVTADFTKSYVIAGRDMQVELRYIGITANNHVWNYKALLFAIGGPRLIGEGPLMRATSRENVDFEELSDNVASFHGADVKPKEDDKPEKAGRGEYTAILLFKDPIEKARTLIWREYYMEGTNAVPIEKVRVIQFTQMYENCWVATVAVDKKEDDRNYKVKYDSKANMIRVDVYVPIEGFNIPL